MRPAAVSTVCFRLLNVLLIFVLALAATLAPAQSDPAQQEAEARFVDASFERLISEMGLGPNNEEQDPGSTRLICLQMCERFRAAGLTPSVNCAARCNRELPVPPVPPVRSDSSLNSSPGVASAAAGDTTRP